MKQSEWIQGQDGKYYYVKSNGDMATNTYVKGTGSNSDVYYWVNDKGEWKPKWDTKNPDLQKYSVAYAKGTLSNPKSQMALTDEYGEELIFHAGSNGNVQYLTKGSRVIPAEVTEKLMKLAYEPYPFNDMLYNNSSKIATIENNNKEQPIHINVTTPLVHVEGGLDTTMLATMKEMCNKIPNEIAMSFKRNGLK